MRVGDEEGYAIARHSYEEREHNEECVYDKGCPPDAPTRDARANRDGKARISQRPIAEHRVTQTRDAGAKDAHVHARRQTLSKRSILYSAQTTRVKVRVGLL